MSVLTRMISLGLFVLAFGGLVMADELDDLARKFWAWRAIEQPISSDDIPRLERPPDWTPEWSRPAVSKYLRVLETFESRWKKIDASRWPVQRQVDHRLLGSALARVRWELEITRSWQQNPMFYVQQTLGAILDRLLQPPPFSEARSKEIVQRMASIPQTVEDAKADLDRPPAPFARVAIDELKDVRPRLLTVVLGLKPYLPADSTGPLDAATQNAIRALESYRDWLQQQLPSLPAETAVGRHGYLFFLKSVGLLPFSPEELLRMSRQEWARAIAFEVFEKTRNQGLPQFALYPNQAAQMAREQKDEMATRRFLEEKGILTVPKWLMHYRNLPLPDYLEPLSDLGVNDDLTSPTRLNENATSYIRPPAPTLGYFALAIARDPRTLIVHEGIPGHYSQLALSWANEDPLRRHYYDSSANEGIGFYAEEMMLQAGLFDDSPRTREVIYNFMRLRALRVEADVKLALGLFTINQAADFLRGSVPMDQETARSEAAFFAAHPGQAISYQVGKLQIMDFLAEARRRQGENFSLRAFHDFLWKNGNVPIALQRWEYLGLKDEVEALGR